MKSKTTNFCSLHHRKAAGHSVGHFAYHGVLVERLAHFIGLMVSVLVLVVGARKASSRVNRLEKSVGKLGLVASAR